MGFAYKSEQWVPCYHPLRGYYGKSVNPKTGRRPIVFNPSQSFSGVPLELPCGQCIGCRLERSRQWAVRIVQEKRMHAESCFLTLTYSDEHLPKNGSLVLRDLQLFMKRLRKQRPMGLRFFACGEYGDVTKRPHYHVLLLNTCFPDQQYWKVNRDHPLYVSAELRELWPVGDSYIGEVSFKSAAYVARYCTKKVTGGAAEVFYLDRSPPFVCMSRRPGIGSSYFEAYGDVVRKLDSVVVDGKEMSSTRFYDGRFERLAPELLAKTKKARRKAALAVRSDNTPERRKVKERFEELKLARFARETDK